MDAADHPHLLLVEDDAALAQTLVEYLTSRGLRVTSVAQGEDALEVTGRGGIDLVILDIMLPGMDGYAVCRALRQEGGLPILMLTARGEGPSKIRGFLAGADDYVVKPFDPEELIARIRALLRRSGRLGDTFPVGNLVVNRNRREVYLGRRMARLTPKEFEVLEALASLPGRPLTRGQLLGQVWGAAADTDDRTVDSTVARLRRKLEALQDEPTPGEEEPPPPLNVRIRALWGVGYRLDVEK